MTTSKLTVLIASYLEPELVEQIRREVPQVEVINPHSASTADTENAKITRLFCDNLKHYLAGEPLQNILDVELYY